MIIIYVIFFGIWLNFNYKKFGFNISSFIISLFFLSSVSSLFILYGYDEFDENRISFLAIIYHIICYYLFLGPIVYFGNKINNKNLFFLSKKQLYPVLYFIIILSISTIIVSFPKMLTSFSFEDLSDARKLHNKRELFDDSDKGFLNYLNNLGSALSFYALFFFFYIFTFYRKSKILLILLFISSFGIVIKNLSIMGRDGVVRWILYFISFYILFNDLLDKKIKKYLKVVSVSIGSVLIVVMLAISISRFGERDLGLTYYLLTYFGQQNIYFSYNFSTFMDGLGGGRITFPYLFSERISVNKLNNLVYSDYNLNTFSGFIGSFYRDLGLFKTFLMAVVFYIMNMIILRKYNFINFIYYLIIYEVVLLGVFYYMFYSPTRVNVLFLFFIISFMVYVIKGNKSSKKI